jgi:hypothetical protein
MENPTPNTSIDVDSLSDEELEQYIENFDEESETLPSQLDQGTNGGVDPQEQAPSQTPDPQQQEDPQPSQAEEQTEGQTSESETTEEPQGNEEIFIPEGFDVETFNKIPDEYKKLFQPIKANGTKIQPEPEKMIQLIQLGSKYYADREKIKPKLELVNMLEKAGVDDKEKLTLALDIVNGDKEALSKFLKDNEIDPIDLDIDESNYNPDVNKYYDPQESKLKEVEAQLQDSPYYENLTKTIASIDQESQSVLLQEPEKLLAINAHMEAGLFDQIMQKINEEKIFGIGLNEPFIKKYERIGLQLIQSQKSGNAQPQTQRQEQPLNQKENNSIQHQEVHQQVPNSIVAGQSGEGNAPIKKVIDLNDPKMIDSLSDEELEKILS